MRSHHSRDKLLAAAAAAFTIGCWLVAANLSPAVAQPSGSVFGWVEIQPAPQRKDQIVIVGHALATTAMEGQFALVVTRQGRGGRSNSRQAGAFKLEAGVSRTLSTTAINVSPAESVLIELKLFGGNRELFSVTLRTAATPGMKDI